MRQSLSSYKKCVAILVSSSVLDLDQVGSASFTRIRIYFNQMYTNKLNFLSILSKILKHMTLVAMTLMRKIKQCTLAQMRISQFFF
jgi:hypothetical protein